MTTQSLRSNTLRYTKLFTVTAAVAFGLSLGLTQAEAKAVEVAEQQTGALSEKQAKGAADIIMAAPEALRYNTAVTVVKNLTAHTGAGFAAINAKLIAKYIPEGQQIALLPAIAKGIAFNYPNQLAAVTAQVILLNQATREHSDQIVAQLAPLAGANFSAQFSVMLNLAMRDHKEIMKKAGVISAMLFSSINSSSTGTAAERANEIAIAAGNLAAGFSYPDDCGAFSKRNQKALDQISQVLTLFMQTVPTGTLTREQLIYNMVGNFSTTLKNSMPPGTPSSQINSILNHIQTVIVQQMVTGGQGSLVPLVNNAIVVVINTPKQPTFPNVGPVTPPETPH